jgi:NADPH:quinone reductase-like Zn-dependent oxidoreductase
MKAFAVPRYGTAPAMLDLSEPPIGPELVARVRFAGVNAVDWKSIGRLTEADMFPCVLGQDFAGIATHVEGDPAVARDDRVFGIASTYGSYAEKTRLPGVMRGEIFARIPEGLSDEQAAALPTPGLTALAALDALEVGANTTLMILGAGGGLGSYAMQIAKARGATVVAIVRGGIEDAYTLGADKAIDASAVDPIPVVRALYPSGVDAILDVVSSPEAIVRVAGALVRHGRIVSTIRAFNDLSEKRLREAGCHGRNVNLFETPQASADGLTRLAEMVLEGAVRVRIKEIRPLAEAGHVLERTHGSASGGHTILQANA